MPRVYNACNEPLKGAISCSTYNSQGDRQNGQYYSQEIQCNSNAVETEHMRGGNDIEVSVS
jgi:hypothetical protein